MESKVIFDIRPEKPLAGFWNDWAQLQQASLRWLLLLRKEKFTLPGFNHLDFLIIESPGEVDLRVVDATSMDNPTFRRLIHCYPQNIPTDPAESLILVNSCVYRSLRLVCVQSAENLKVLEDVFERVQREGDLLQIPTKKASNKNFEAKLFIQPSGPHNSGGFLHLVVIDKHTQAKRSAALLEYYYYWDIKDLQGKLTITNDTLTIAAVPNWVRHYPSVDGKIEISISRFINAKDDFLMSDTTGIQRVLRDRELPW